MRRKVLLATMYVGGGHTALRDSFDRALARLDPESRLFERVLWESKDQSMYGFYSNIVHYVPSFQQVLYSVSDWRVGARATSAAYPRILDEACAALKQHAPDVVVTTHVVLSMLFARARRRLGLSTRLVSAIPDYGPTTKMFFPDQDDLRADACIVMDPATRAQLVDDRGFPEEDIHLSGFLPNEAFTATGRDMDEAGRLSPGRRAQLWRALSAEHPQLATLDPQKPTFIFLGGSAWTSKTLPVLKRLLASPDLLARLNLIIVCGKNAPFAERLERRTAGRERIATFGFVKPDTLARLISVADYPVLGSLAPASLQELLELRCGPLLLFHFIPGAERPHVAYLQEHGLGLYEPNADRMVQAIAELAGVLPTHTQLEALRQGFYGRAQAMRAANQDRSLALPRFLSRVCGDGVRSTSENRSVGAVQPAVAI